MLLLELSHPQHLVFVNQLFQTANLGHLKEPTTMPLFGLIWPLSPTYQFKGIV